ncbi:MAG: hypothetical protein Q9162_001309 [Coniocarpon cinnabarinum]
MHSLVQAHTYVALRLPSGLHKVLKIRPETIIHLGKYGTFNANDLLGRPFYLTYEVLDKEEQHLSSLRIIPPAELHALAVSDHAATPSESRDVDSLEAADPDESVRATANNQLTVDDPARQSLTMDDIEELKATGSGRDVIAKIMASHSHLGEKTAYSLAKYSLRKRRKYMKMFTILPLDVSTLAYWYLQEKEAAKIMELREDTLGLMLSWANCQSGQSEMPAQASGRWLVVDDTAGLLVAAMAERMNILHPPRYMKVKKPPNYQVADEAAHTPAVTELDHVQAPDREGTSQAVRKSKSSDEPHLADFNTITLVHSATQPNISLLSYFSFDPNGSETPASHPLHKHLHTLTWLQLLDPKSDITYTEPLIIPASELQAMKSGRRGAYYRKRRRWAQCKTIVDQTRAGGFDGLIVATHMELSNVLHHLVPLVRGGAPIVAYSPNNEPVAEVTDFYSSGRKTAFLTSLYENGREPEVPSDDFPLDPCLVLAPSLQTVRAREWQALPGRTHPVMTMKGGAEGYVFTGTRVWPAEGKVEARGNFAKKRKMNDKAVEAADMVDSET